VVVCIWRKGPESFSFEWPMRGAQGPPIRVLVPDGSELLHTMPGGVLMLFVPGEDDPLARYAWDAPSVLREATADAGARFRLWDAMLV
jgi:hypothetical protein